MGIDARANKLDAKKSINLLVEIALKEVGIIEHGVNLGARLDEYRSAIFEKKVKDLKDPWCGYFVGFCYLKAGIDIEYVKSPSIAQSWFLDEKRIVYSKNRVMPYGVYPRPGDVVGYLFKSGRISHIGIIIEWNQEEGYFLSVEGNTSNSNSVYRDSNKNDGVRLKKRKISLAWKVSRVVI